MLVLLARMNLGLGAPTLWKRVGAILRLVRFHGFQRYSAPPNLTLFGLSPSPVVARLRDVHDGALLKHDDCPVADLHALEALLERSGVGRCDHREKI